MLKRGLVFHGTVTFLFGLSLLLLWPVALIIPSVATSVRKPAKAAKEQMRSELPPVESLDSLERVTHRIRRGDTLGKLLKPFGLSKEEKQSWIRSIRKHYSPKRLRTGGEIYFFFTKNGSNQEGEDKTKHLKALELDLNEDWALTWERKNQGIVFRKRERPYEIKVRTSGGTITESFYRNGIRLGLHPTVISQFVDIFAWNVNFRTDIKSGDSFKVLYNRRYRKGSKNETFHILAAALINREQKHFAFYFQKENGEGNYYDLEGKSLARSFLRYPVEFSRISSTFSHVRFHPILKVRRPHRGVDFVAKRGTPVRAVGDGRVAYAGWKNAAYGKFIEIRHGSMYRTYYAHLRGFARGIRRGAKVKKGQIIGYVGCTGRCTGPHLHFEFYKNRRYVNPLKIELPPEDGIESALRNNFDNFTRLFLAKLTESPRS